MRVNLLRALPTNHPRIVHGFTTREGGVSTGSLASLNLALREHETVEKLEENWRRAVRSLGGDLELSDLAVVNQIHTNNLVVIEGGDGPLCPVGDADALLSTTPGVVLAIRTADCVPILFAAPGGVAAAHAGWRGVAMDVAGGTLRRLCEEARCSPADVAVAVGPHIGPAAYVVGREVIDGIASTGVPPDLFVRDGDHVDLRSAVVHQLRRVGAVNIGHVMRCTATDPALFSHRADGPSTGRLGALIGIRP